jgi:hypothetical protein
MQVVLPVFQPERGTPYTKRERGLEHHPASQFGKYSDMNMSQQVTAQRPVKRAPTPDPEVRHVPSAPEEAHKSSGYGLPCSKCRLYYPADLDICPYCHTRERVSPVVAPAAPAAGKVQTAAEPVPNTEVLEQQREEFLQQFKSQLIAEHVELTAPPCSLGHVADEEETATICKPCYDRLQQRVDVCEAALHIDLKEAARIVYDAVWADPSDPNKTYTNAANALLTELRKRAGISNLLTPFQPLAH